MAVWSLIWVSAFLAVDIAIDNGWTTGGLAVPALTAVVALLGIGWLRSYARFLRHADELMRKIQLDAMALALGTGFIAGFSLVLLEGGDLVEAHPSYVLVAMAAVYIGVVLGGLYRYGSDPR